MATQVIHVVLGKANPNRMNGVNKVVNSLATAQSALGYDVRLWGITSNPVHDYPERNYKTELFMDSGKFSLDSRIRKELSLLDPKNTVFHIHGGFIPQFFMISQLLVKTGIRYNYTPHGSFNTVALERSALKKKFYINVFERYVVKHAHRIHLIGKSEITGTQAVFGEVEHVLIPNGQDESPAEYSKNRNTHPVFGFIGRLDMHTKGLDLLFNAFAKTLAYTAVEAELWLIGDGADRQRLEALARDLSIDQAVKFLGPIYGNEKQQAISQMDFLCLNSRNEGLPGVVLEAASDGVPVIVSEETNMGDYVRKYNAGFVTDINDAENISASLIEAISALGVSKQKVLGENAKTMVKSEFNWNTIAVQHIQAYAA